MSARELLFAAMALLLLQVPVSGQQADSAILLTGIVFNQSFKPLPASHVLNLNSRQGVITDSLGIFSLRAEPSDTLLIMNISYRDTMVTAARVRAFPQVILKNRYYKLEEARIFEWGSTYNDFRQAIVGMPNQESLGESMELPRQDPDYVPLEMDPQQVKSLGHLLHNPLNYLYQNFNKHAKSARTVYWLEKDKEKIDLFTEITGTENLSQITGLDGDDLLKFKAFLNERMVCDYHCSELKLYTEIHAIWDLYQKIEGLEN